MLAHDPNRADVYKRTKRKFRDDGVAIRNPKSGQPDFAHRSRESTPRASGWVRFKLSGPNTIGPSSCRLHFSIQANGSRVLKRQTGARFIQTSPKILAFLPRLPSSPSFLAFLPRLPSSPSFLAFLPRLPSSPSFLAFLPRLPSSPSFLAFLPRLPSSPSFLAFLPRLPSSPSFLAFLPSWNFSGHWFWLSKPLPTSQYPGKHSFANLAHRWRNQNHG